MTEQHPAAAAPQQPAEEQPSAAEQATGNPFADPFADLEHRPVAEHVAVFETEHARLQQELSSIDQL